MHRGVDRWVFNIAPLLSVMAVLMLWSSFRGRRPVGVDLSVGVVYVIAAGAISAIDLMAGWGSNNKFALLGRSARSRS